MPLGLITAAALPGNSDAVLLARVRSRVNAALITQATVSAISYALQDLTAGTQISAGTFAVSSTIFDALQLDALWTKDSTALPGTDQAAGYNFRATVPAANLPLSSSGNRMHCDVKITMVSGETIRLAFEWASIKVYG